MTNMKPILFSTAMVQAIMAGNKTQTRRAVKPQPKIFGDIYKEASKCYLRVGAMLYWQDATETKCPYGQPGDVLWVREEHYRWGIWVRDGLTKKGNPKWRFKALADDVEYVDTMKVDFRKSRDKQSPGKPQWYKRLARFMPRSACRLFLKITDIRVERLQEINEADTIAEGLKILSKDYGKTYKYGIADADGLPGNDDHGWHWPEWEVNHLDAVKKLWTKINGPESWEANPWVWVVSFQKTEKP